MILYHGSYLEIVTPDLEHSRANVDFGRGFYTTPIYGQAVNWCGKFKRRGRMGIVTCYDFDERAYEGLLRLRYEKPNLQICFRTMEAIEGYLHFRGSEQV